jgi:hypothetical protein
MHAVLPQRAVDAKPIHMHDAPKLSIDFIGVAASRAGAPAILGRVRRRGQWREKQSRER